MNKLVTHLSQNSIKHKIENNDAAINESEMILQIVDHKLFDDTNGGKKGIKSR